MRELFTIGHSTHEIRKFIELLMMHSITAIGDVRSTPYSRVTPQFNRETLRKELSKYNIAYVFLGNELGARSNNPNCYINGKVQFDCLAREPAFQEGINRVLRGLDQYHIALMCAEKDPISCHRMILVCRNLRKYEIEINHILENGHLEYNTDTEKRLLAILKIEENSLFENGESVVEQAYNLQSDKIAFVKPSNETANNKI